MISESASVSGQSRWKASRRAAADRCRDRASAGTDLSPSGRPIRVCPRSLGVARPLSGSLIKRSESRHSARVLGSASSPRPRRRLRRVLFRGIGSRRCSIPSRSPRRGRAPSTGMRSLRRALPSRAFRASRARSVRPCVLRVGSVSTASSNQAVRIERRASERRVSKLGIADGRKLHRHCVGRRAVAERDGVRRAVGGAYECDVNAVLAGGDGRPDDAASYGDLIAKCGRVKFEPLDKWRAAEPVGRSSGHAGCVSDDLRLPDCAGVAALVGSVRQRELDLPGTQQGSRLFLAFDGERAGVFRERERTSSTSARKAPVLIWRRDRESSASRRRIGRRSGGTSVRRRTPTASGLSDIRCSSGSWGSAAGLFLPGASTVTSGRLRSLKSDAGACSGSGTSFTNLSLRPVVVAQFESSRRRSVGIVLVRSPRGAVQRTFCACSSVSSSAWRMCRATRASFGARRVRRAGVRPLDVGAHAVVRDWSWGARGRSARGDRGS